MVNNIVRYRVTATGKDYKIYPTWFYALTALASMAWTECAVCGVGDEKRNMKFGWMDIVAQYLCVHCWGCLNA